MSTCSFCLLTLCPRPPAKGEWVFFMDNFELSNLPQIKIFINSKFETAPAPEFDKAEPERSFCSPVKSVIRPPCASQCVDSTYLFYWPFLICHSATSLCLLMTTYIHLYISVFGIHEFVVFFFFKFQIIMFGILVKHNRSNITYNRMCMRISPDAHTCLSPGIFFQMFCVIICL